MNGTVYLVGAGPGAPFATPRVGNGEQAGNWADGLKTSDAGAIYMGVGKAAAIAATLLTAGKPSQLPVAVVENASLPEQRIRYTTLAALPRLAAAEILGAAIILLGPQFTARAVVDAQAFDARCRDAAWTATG